ncbi:hypothetical protein CU097_010313 [Rhizopus azygosporus]|uniref:MI domain-containing protein n=1 Tax=Rhizopus azygosporus TaxID=86630 RepID=A0A367K170_RHIAZ|nr:hypothetical protein CU097_010313 [Rhizopus azygosporus]
MNKAIHNSENVRPNKFNYAQAARPNYPRNPSQPQQQQQRVEGAPNSDQQTEFKNSSTYSSSLTHGHSSFKRTYSSNMYKSKDSTYNNYKKPSVQLPMAPPTETTNIQFGSINQAYTPASTANGSNNKTGDIPVLKEVQFGSLPATDATLNRSQFRSQQQQQPKTEIPRSTRTTNDARLFTQPYAPRRDFNQGDFSNNNNNNNNNNRYYNNRHNGNYKSGYNKSAGSQQNSYYNNNNNHNNNSSNNNTSNNHNSSTTSTNSTNSSNNIVSYQQYPQQQQQQQQPSQQSSTQPSSTSPHLQPSIAPSSSHHRSPKIQQSPQLQQQQQSPQQHQVSPVHASPSNVNYTKKNASPNMAQSSQNIPATTTTTWSPQYMPFYPQYPVPVAAYSNMAPNRSYVPPPAKKVIPIVNPNTGTAIDTTPMALSTTTAAPVTTKTEKFDFQIPQPNVSKRVEIVDPAIRDRELREKREREEAELEAKRKAEEERLEQERRAAEEKERLEREEKERLEREREEKERLEREEQERKEREEAERIEKERLAALEAERKKKQEEEEAQRKAEEEQELRRIKSELEAKKKKDEEERARSATVIDTSLASDHKSSLTQSPVSATPTPLANDRPIQLIEDPSTIKYPPNVQPPSKVDGKYMYSVEFLKLFSTLCKDTTADLSVVNEAVDSSKKYKTSGPSTGSNLNRERSSSHRTHSGDPSTFRMGSRDGRMEMGKFNTGRPLNPRSNSSGMFMERQPSGRGGGMGGRGMGRSTPNGMKIIRNPSQQASPALEPVAPLTKTENRWVPTVAVQQANDKAASADSELLSEEVITRKVKALLNKLTIEKFDSISEQIFSYAKQSEKEEDGMALRTVIKLTFEKACDEPAFASMWARLCHRMSSSMTNDIRDTSLLDDQGNPSCGVLLFRKYLFSRCQVEFEKGWKVNMPEADESAMLTDEYYAAAKAKRQGLGLIQFIGELFKLEMLSERIMYGCLIKLCNDPQNAGDEEAESLCKLLTTIGKTLDSKPKTSKWVDIVTARMKNEMMNSPKISSRVKFMIQDVFDLRKQNWVPRNASNQVGPTTLAKIHEMAEKDKEHKETNTVKRGNSSRGPFIPNQYNSNNNNMQRTSSFRGGRDYHGSNTSNNAGSPSNDGWNTVGSGSSSPVSDKSRANELSNFGKTDRSRSKNNLLGPSNSPFPSLTRNKTGSDSKGPNDGRASPAMNMFSALSNGDKPEERKKLQLLPRSTPADESNFTDSNNTATTTTVTTSSNKLSDEVVKRKSKNIIDEYFGIRDKKELAECVKELDDVHYLEIFVEEMLTVVERKSEDVDTMADIMAYLLSEKLLDKQIYINAFKKFMEGYEDLLIDVPQAPKHVAKLLEASSLTSSDEGTEDIFKHLK